MKTSVLALLLFWVASTATSQGQTFTLGTNQMDICAVPQFNHTPIGVAIATNTASLSNIVVSSDSAWVTPTVDVATSKLRLTFVTSNLINSLYTATITASSGNTTNTLFVRANVAALNPFKLKDDPFRSRTYGVHQNGTGIGCVFVIDPIATNYIGNITVGLKPSDMAISSDGTELFVINCVSASISVIDLNTLALKQTLALPAFGNWGVNDTTANVGVGPGNILYYTDGSWAPVLRVLDRSTMQILQTDMIDPSSGSGFGDFGLTSDKKLLYGWMQYGWSAGIASSYISRFTVGADGLLTYTDSGASQYSTQFQRDPLETPVLIANDNKTIFIKGFAVSSNSASDIKYTFPTPVYSITPGGEIAVTATAIYETATGNKLLDLPVSTSVQTISSDYARLIYWDSSAHSLKFINLLSAIGPGILNRNITPANNSITLSPPQLQWTSLPGIDRYRVYFGTVEADVTAATTNSPLYLGQVNQTFFPINTTLTSGVKYFWRVDAVSDFDVAKGDTYNFTVSTISSSTNQISGATVQGHSDYITSFNLSSQLAGQDWQATANQSWVTFTQSNGVTPATVQVHLNASQLPVGLQSATITISSGGTALFSIPISLRVDALKMTQIRSDPVSALAYAVSEDTSVTPNRAYLLELDSAAEKILRVVAVGSSVTDIAVHNGDNRIYVPNWMSGSLLAINKTTFQLARTYAFAPFGGVGYSQGDIYRVAPGAPGRLIWEEEDQWIDVKIFDTVNATNMATAFERQGGGASTGGGRYYYHGDDNSSGATIHKFDLVGDQFAELANVRVQSYSYYGSRVVVASEDGSRVFWNGSMFDANLTELWTMADQVYCTSTNGQFAFGQNKIYDTTLKQAVLSMPAASTVSAYNTTSQKLIVQVGSSLAFYQISSPLTLPTPTLFADTITSSSVALHWTDKSLEDSFTVQMRIVGASNWTDVASPASNVTNYTATGLAPQTSYEFRVKANAAGATSAWSASVFANTPGISPTTPILTATSTFTSITVNWSNPTNETGFVLERTVGTNAFTTLAVLPADTLSFADNNVTQGTTYSYRIKATNSWGASAYSSTLNVTVPIPTPPATPTGLTVKVISSNSVSLTWADVATETGYRVRSRTEDTNTLAVVATLNSNVTTCVISNLTTGIQYYFSVQAFNAVGNSAFSAEVSATPYNIVRLIEDNFDPAIHQTAWSSITGGIATNGGTGFHGSQALWFGATGVRSAVTVPVDVSHGGQIDFIIRAGNETVDGNTFWNNSETGETVSLDYSKDGVNWTNIQILNTVYPSLSTWTTYSIIVPTAALSTRTQFRWIQSLNSGTGFDCWAIDDFDIVGAQPVLPSIPPFILSSPNSSTAMAILWASSTGATYYVLERKQGTNAWTAIANIPAAATYFTDTSVLPNTAYSYRVKAGNSGGESGYSSTTTSITWSQMQQWIADNYGSPDAITTDQLQQTGPDGLAPILRFAFDLNADEPGHFITPGQSTNGYPTIWRDPTSGRLSAEFLRRKASANPGIDYKVLFGSSLTTWTTNNTPALIQSIDTIWERVRFDDATPSSTIRFGRVIVVPQ